MPVIDGVTPPCSPTHACVCVCVQLSAVPNYLRTKLSLELESKQRERWEMCRKEGGAVSVEDIEKFNRVLSSALERVNGLKEKMDERKTRAGE